MARRRADGSRRLRLIERLLFAVAVVALGWYGAAHIIAARAQAAWAKELEGMASRTARVEAAGSRPPRRGALIGRIAVARLGVSAVAREGVDATTLRHAVGHVPSTPLPGRRGNSAFAGHRDTFFRGLRDVGAGDRIDVTTPEGVYTYVVDRTNVVSPSDVSVLDPTRHSTLTLVTCYPFRYIGPAPNRFVVRATLAETRASAPSN